VIGGKGGSNAPQQLLQDLVLPEMLEFNPLLPLGLIAWIMFRRTVIHEGSQLDDL
jgi:hypothetical protein